MNNLSYVQEGTLATSLPLLLLQVLNLTQISSEVQKRVEQLELTSSIELARKHISEAIKSRQPMWKRNEQLTQSNNRLLELISNEIQWYSVARLRNRELLQFLSKLELNSDTNSSCIMEISAVANGTESEKRLRFSLNYTVDEYHINNFQPLSPDDVEVMLHTFLPHNPVSQQKIGHGDEVRKYNTEISHDNNEARISSTLPRQRRSSEPSVLNLLVRLYNYTGKSDKSKWESFTSGLSLLGLEKIPVRRNEQLQNINLQLQKMVLEVIQEQRKEQDENYQLQQKLLELLIKRNDVDEKQKHFCRNQTINHNHLESKPKKIDYVTKEGNDQNHKLESQGNNITKLQEQQNFTYPDKDKQLFEASRSGNLSAVLFLTTIQANVSIHDENGLTPLHWAAKESHLELARVLLEAGANPDAKDTGGNAPIHLAAQYAISEMVQLLINSSKTLELKNTEGETPLQVAIRSGNIEAALQLIKLGSNLTSVNNEDRTPLHLAALTGEEEVAQMLVDSGCEVDARSGNGYSPLHLAALHGHVGVCRILLDAGAYVNALTFEKQTPLHLAVLSGHFPTVELLVQRGAKVKVKNSKGRTPSGIAVRKGYKRIVAFLEKH